MNRVDVKRRQQELFPGVVTDYAYHGPALALTEICLEVRQAINGASEPWPQSLIQDTKKLLADVLLTWEPSATQWDHEMDEAVRSLIQATLHYIEKRTSEPG